MTIDLTNGSTTLQWNAPTGFPQRWDAIVWNPTGTAVWGSERDALYKWDPVTGTAAQVCGAGFLPDKTEALSFDPSGQLLGGWHDPDSATMAIFKIDVATCTTSDGDFAVPFDDVESFAFELCEPRALGSLGDRVWYDANANGVLDVGEAGFGGVTVELLDSEGVVVATTTTSGTGVYYFSGLPADTYTVRVDETTLPPGVWRAPSDIPKKWDALAWSPDGTVAWGSERSELIRYDAITETAAVVCGPDFLPDKTEALDVGPDGLLYGGWHNEAAASLTLFIINVDTCTISTTDINTTFNDIESLAFEVCN